MAVKTKKGRALVARPSHQLVPVRKVAGTNAIALQLYRVPELHPQQPGPWADEPDKVSWVDATTGYPCTILRHQDGTLAGHVAVGVDHPFHGFDENALPAGLLRVHGGVTWSGSCQQHVPEARSVCHVHDARPPSANEMMNRRAVEEGRARGNVWWLGFSTNTSVDVIPAARTATFLGEENGQIYRDETYVAQQCTQLAAQLHAVEHDLPMPVLAFPPPPLGLEPHQPAVWW